MPQNKSLIIMIDASGSMATRGRNDAVNIAMERLKDDVFDKATIPADLNITIRVLKFQGDEQTGYRIAWVIGNENDGVALNRYSWMHMSQSDFADGTPTGKAVMEVTKCLYQNGESADPNQVAPAIILISDGESNGEPTLTRAIADANAMKVGLEKEGLFKRALRAAIGINVDPAGRTELQGFGRLSKSMRNKVQAYYDCTDNDLDGLRQILSSLTMGFTEAPANQDEDIY